MPTEFDLYRDTHADLIARLEHKLKAVLDLIKSGDIEADKSGLYRADISLNLTEANDILTDTLITKTLFDKMCQLYNKECPYGLTDVDINSIGVDRPSVRINLEFIKDER